MKKKNVKWIFNNHSTERFFDRTALNVTKKDVAKAITNNQVIPFKRVNATRSMTYIHVKGEVIKTVMHRKKNKIITVLPWRSIFQFRMEFTVKKFNNRRFRVNIFPDCYMETKNRHALTKIFEWHPATRQDESEGYTKLQINHPLFDKIFDTAWCNFVIAADEHIKINERRKEGHETFEIKGKAQEVDSIIPFL